MVDLSRYLLPYQVRWIRSHSAVLVGEKGRRVGWTYASAFRAVVRRLRLGTDLYYTSADLSAAREFVEECRRWARVFNVVALDMGPQVVDEREGLTAFVLRFENGARILAGSSNPKFFRGKGGDADADEFAFHAQPRDLYRAMQPAALMWGHQMRLWSTHNGEGSFFNRLLKEARRGQEEAASSGAGEGQRAGAGGQDGEHGTQHPALGTSPDRPVTGQPVRTYRVTLVDAVAQGLVERIRNLPAPDPVARRDFLASIRASCPDEDAWNEEYMCRPSSNQSALLPYGVIAACEAANLRVWGVEEGSGFRVQGSGEEGPPLSSLNPEPRTLNPLYAGFDVGRKRDRSVLWVLERVGDVFWTRVVHVMEAAPFSAQEELLDAVMAARPADAGAAGGGAWAVRRLCVDATGMGAMLAERLAQRWKHRVEPVLFTAGSKAELALPLVRLFQERLVRIPADATIRADLHKVRRSVTAAGNVRLDADRDADGHADRFWALALAHHAADVDPARLPAPLVRKPVGW